MRRIRLIATLALLMVVSTASAALNGWSYSGFDFAGSGWAYGSFAYDDEASEPESTLLLIMQQMAHLDEVPE